MPTSPSAKAFFDALDAKEKEIYSSNQDLFTKKTHSNFISKRIDTLGWRTRYSQQELYPVTIYRRTVSMTSQSNVNPINFSIRQVQRGEIEGTYGTGATVWPASIVLVKYLERHAQKLVQGKRVIDLGAGTGISSLAAAIFGATEVVCTDGEESVVQLARENIINVAASIQPSDETGDEVDFLGEEKKRPASSIPILNSHIWIEKYWWGSNTIVTGGNVCDLILVSDCVLPKLYPIAPLVQALDILLQRPDSMAILSYEHRYYPEYDPRDKFFELVTERRLAVEKVPLEEQDPVYSTDDIEIWCVRRERHERQDKDPNL